MLTYLLLLKWWFTSLSKKCKLGLAIKTLIFWEPLDLKPVNIYGHILTRSNISSGFFVCISTLEKIILNVLTLIPAW